MDDKPEDNKDGVSPKIEKAAKAAKTVKVGRPPKSANVTKGPDPAEKNAVAAANDFDLLSEEQKDALRAKARERVLELRRQAAEDEFLKQAEYEERVKQGVASNIVKTDKVKVYIDLPEYADRITINGVIYFQGAHYTVQHDLYDSLVDIMARAWEHQSEIEGKPRRHYNKKRGMVINGVNGQMIENDKRAAA